MDTQLPDDILLFILTLVASSSLKDALNLSESCKLLRRLFMTDQILNCCTLNEISLIWARLVQSEHMIEFLNLLDRSGNPKFCFRMALLNIRASNANYEAARRFSEIALRQGHVGAKYTFTILSIFSGGIEDKEIGSKMLTELYDQKQLFKCRSMIKDAWHIDRPWTLRRSWPDNLVYTKICNFQSSNSVCLAPKLKKGIWMATSDDDYEDKTCMHCRLDLERQWFLKEKKYDPPVPPQNL